MIESKYFHREAVSSRMLDHAAKEWGYDNSELENFDPLISLLMGGLAKEIEKSYQTFEESYSRVVNHIIETLIPGNKLDFLPAHNIIHLENMNEMSIVDKSSITLRHTISIDKEDKEIEFVPILPSETLPLQVKYIADGHGIYSVTGIDRFEDYRYSDKDNSIYIGIDSNLTKHTSIVDLDLYVDWLNFPDKKKMVEIGHMVKWTKGGTELMQQKKSSFEFINKIAQDEFWSNYPFVDRIKSIYSSYKKRLFTLKDVDFSQKDIPEFLLNISNAESSLNTLKDLHWIKLELPPHSASKDFARHLFCQTNCFPFINMNKGKLLKKVKAPFKVLKLNTENHFVDVMSIENTEGEIYTAYNTITNSNNRAGTFRVISDGVQRINKKKATEAINNILDTIKEERNAFAAQNPDWIVDELLDIKKTVNRIKGKLNITSEIEPSDVFVEFESDKPEDVLSINYWSSNANEANNIIAGTFFNIEGESTTQNAVAVNISQGGKSYIGSHQKLKNFQSSLFSRKSIVSANDIKLFVSGKLAQYDLRDIQFDKVLVTTNDKNEGYRHLYKVEAIVNKVDDGIDIYELERIIEDECNANSILGFEILVKISKYIDE